MLWMLGASLAAPPATSTVWSSSGRELAAGCLMATGRWAVLDSRGLHRQSGSIDIGDDEFSPEQVVVLGDCEMIAFAETASSTLRVLDPWKGDVQTLDAGIDVRRIGAGPSEKWIVVSDGKRVAAVDWKSGRAVQLDGKPGDGLWRFSKDGAHLQIATNAAGTKWNTHELESGAKVDVEGVFRTAKPRRWLSEWPTSWALGDGANATIGMRGLHVQNRTREASGFLRGAGSMYRTEDETLYIAVYSGRPAEGEPAEAFQIERLSGAREALLDWFDNDAGARTRGTSAGGSDLDPQARKAFNELQRHQSRTFKTGDAALEAIRDVAPGSRGEHLVLEAGQTHSLELGSIGSFGLLLAGLPEEVEEFEVKQDGKTLAMTKLKPAATGVFTHTKFVMAVRGESAVEITPVLKPNAEKAHVYAVAYRMRPRIEE